MTAPRRTRPIPGAALRIDLPDRTLWNGNCPICEAPVLWAVDRTDGGDGSMWHAPLDPHVFPAPPTDQVWVIVSSTGEASSVQPVLHHKHACPPEVVQELLQRIGSLGYYTAEVLAVGCPVRPCGAAPGMLCLSARREAIPRPHGARAVLARGEELEDPTF